MCIMCPQTILNLMLTLYKMFTCFFSILYLSLILSLSTSLAQVRRIISQLFLHMELKVPACNKLWLGFLSFNEDIFVFNTYFVCSNFKKILKREICLRRLFLIKEHAKKRPLLVAAIQMRPFLEANTPRTEHSCKRQFLKEIIPSSVHSQKLHITP